MSSWTKAAPILMAVMLSGAAVAQGGINVTVDNTPVTFDQPPVMIGGSVMVPMRGVFERLGADVVYNGATRTIRATHGQTVIELGLGQPTASINGQVRQLTTPASSVGGRTMVPLRFVSEALGADVRWTPSNRTVAITTGGPGPGPNPGYQPTPPPATYGQPHIYSVVTNQPNGLHPGDNVMITLQGDPGGQASFDITGLFNNVPMQDQGGGRYVGNVQIPYQANLANAQIIGRLSTQGGQAVFPVNVGVAQPPGFRRIEPREGEVEHQERPHIHLSLSEGQQLVPSSVRVIVNGNDVTGQSSIGLDEISYTPTVDLPHGTNTVYVTASDAQGNRLQKQWNFTVERAQASIRSVTFPQTGPIAPGQALNVTLLGERGGQAFFDIGSYRTNIPMTEVSPGQYIGSYQVQPGDNIANVTVLGHLRVNGQRPSDLPAPTPVSLGFGGGFNNNPNGFGALFVQFSGPQPGIPVSDRFMISGQTRPNVLVTLSVRVDSGGLFNFNGNVLNNVQVTAGPNGFFQYPFQGTVPFRGGSYVITATAADPASGQTSQPATEVVPRQ